MLAVSCLLPTTKREKTVLRAKQPPYAGPFPSMDFFPAVLTVGQACEQKQLTHEAYKGHVLGLV